jgi:hypothetical protein
VPSNFVIFDENVVMVVEGGWPRRVIRGDMTKSKPRAVEMSAGKLFVEVLTSWQSIY